MRLRLEKTYCRKKKVILNTDKKFGGSKNKAEQTELKRIRNQTIQILEDFGESYVDL